MALLLAIGAVATIWQTLPSVVDARRTPTIRETAIAPMDDIPRAGPVRIETGDSIRAAVIVENHSPIADYSVTPEVRLTSSANQLVGAAKGKVPCVVQRHDVHSCEVVLALQPLPPGRYAIQVTLWSSTDGQRYDESPPLAWVKIEPAGALAPAPNAYSPPSPTPTVRPATGPSVTPMPIATPKPPAPFFVATTRGRCENVGPWTPSCTAVPDETLDLHLSAGDLLASTFCSDNTEVLVAKSGTNQWKTYSLRCGTDGREAVTAIIVATRDLDVRFRGLLPNHYWFGVTRTLTPDQAEATLAQTTWNPLLNCPPNGCDRNTVVAISDLGAAESHTALRPNIAAAPPSSRPSKVLVVDSSKAAGTVFSDQGRWRLTYLDGSYRVYGSKPPPSDWKQAGRTRIACFEDAVTFAERPGAPGLKQPWSATELGLFENAANSLANLEAQSQSSSVEITVRPGHSVRCVAIDVQDAYTDNLGSVRLTATRLGDVADAAPSDAPAALAASRP